MRSFLFNPANIKSKLIQKSNLFALNTISNGLKIENKINANRTALLEVHTKEVELKNYIGDQRYKTEINI